MSYARFGQDDSDVYVFRTVMGGEEAFECCACSFVDDADAVSPNFFSETAATMADHLKAHRDGGEVVPDYAIDDLLAGVAR